MFSPLTAVTGGTLVFALAGLLLVMSPAVDPADRPGADAGLDVPPSLFQGEVSPTGREAQLSSAAIGTREDGSTFDYGNGYEGSWFVTDDPRISGSLDWIWNTESPPAPDGQSEPGGGISTVLVRVSNDEGSWSGAPTWVNVDQPSGIQSGTEIMSGWLTGAGAYDGLMAYMAIDTDTWKVMGYVTASGPPPAPEGFPSDMAP